VFMPSQLLEISQRFHSDVEDLLVLLQEEGLPVQSAECLQQLVTRLGSDPRFRSDVAFLIRSMVGREPDQPGSREPGSMDVLGILVIAAEGIRQPSETPARQQLVRELLRFVIQQRRPEAAPAVALAAAPVQRRATTPITPSPPSPTRLERPSPAPSVAVPAAPSRTHKPPVQPDPVPVPSLLRPEPEPIWSRARAGWAVAVLLVLIVLGAGVAILHSASKAKTPEVTALPAALPAAAPIDNAAAEPERPVILPPSPRPAHTQRKPSPSHTRALHQRAEPSQPSALLAVAGNTPSDMLERPEPHQSNPPLNQPLTAGTTQPVRPLHQSAARALPSNSPQQRATPGSADVTGTFAHPDAANAAASQVPPPAFHPKAPVLIARNKPPAIPGEPQLQGIVHTGTTGTMASKLMSSPEPEYPPEAIAAGVSGQVTVEAVVGPRGNVVDARVVSGPPLLREAALDAIGHWKYRPYEEDGKPVSIATTAIFDFQIPPKR